MYTIGQLARVTGLPVKTIRFYSDSGLLPPAERTAAGYRRYSDGDRARLELIRTLRDNRLGLEAIGKVVDREMDLAAAVALQLRTVEAQIRALQRVRAVLRAALAPGGPGVDYLGRLGKLAKLTAAERARLVDGFMDRVAEGIPMDQDWYAGLRRASLPDLPEDPSDEQLDAWLELAQLLSDPDYERRIREIGELFWTEVPPDFDRERFRAAQRETVKLARAAIEAGMPPGDPGVLPAVEALTSSSAEMLGRPDDAAFRVWLLELVERAAEPRAERYWELVAIINGWPRPSPSDTVSETYRWLHDGLRHLVDEERRPGPGPGGEPPPSPARGRAASRRHRPGRSGVDA